MCRAPFQPIQSKTRSHALRGNLHPDALRSPTSCPPPQNNTTSDRPSSATPRHTPPATPVSAQNADSGQLLQTHFPPESLSSFLPGSQNRCCFQPQSGSPRNYPPVAVATPIFQSP